MPIIKHILFSTLFLLIYNVDANTTPEYIDYKLYHSYKMGKMDVWVKVIAELNIQYNVQPSIDLLYRIVEIQFGYIGYLIGMNESRAARDYLSKAEKNVDAILQIQPQNADALAIKASLLAYHIALSPYKAPFLGPKSLTLIDEALSKNSKSIQPLIEKGNALNYSPALFGGNPEEAVKYYKKAIIAFENQNGGNPPLLWIYLNTITQLALAYEKSNQFQQAQHTYNQILSIEPDFKWVNEELYPKFKKKMELNR